MSTSEYDSLRPPDLGRRGGKRRRKQADRTGAGRGGDGTREMPMVPEAEFTSYYGRPVVKPAPWGPEIAGYLFFGGLSAGSALLGLGARLTGRPKLRRNARLSAMGAAGAGLALVVSDLGRPERFLNLLRTVKVTSPMNLGAWIFSAFSTGVAVTAAGEVDRLTGERLPLGPLRKVLHVLEDPAAVGSALLAPPLAVYTAVLLSDTSTPTWNAAREDLPFVFAASGSMAAGGLAMITTPVDEAGPARGLAVIGAAGDLAATTVMEHRMDQIAAEPLHQGRPGTMLTVSKVLTVAGGVGALIGGRHRGIAAGSGLALIAASALTRLGVLEAGIASAKDPRYTVEPQKNRLAARRASGTIDDSITTVE